MDFSSGDYYYFNIFVSTIQYVHVFLKIYDDKYLGTKNIQRKIKEFYNKSFINNIIFYIKIF